jgi:uncharacterized membrane protein YbhN (UPF0104 family)
MKTSEGWASVGLWGRRLLRLMALTGLGVGTWYSLQGLHWDALWAAMLRADLRWLALGAAVNFANMGFKSLAWDLLLPPGSNVPRWAMFRYTVATGALNILMPFKAGEAVRIFRLNQFHRVKMSALVTVAAMEKVLDVITLLILLAPLPWLLPGLPPWVVQALRTCTVATLIGMVGLAIWIFTQPHRGPEGVRAAVAQARTGGRRLPIALFVIGLSWCVDWLLIELVLGALGLHLAPITGLLVLFVLNLAIAIPSTPGQMGVLELGASTGLMALSVPQDQALAFGLLYHAAQVLPLLLYLVLDGRFVWRMLGGMRKAQLKRTKVTG